MSQQQQQSPTSSSSPSVDVAASPTTSSTTSPSAFASASSSFRSSSSISMLGSSTTSLPTGIISSSSAKPSSLLPASRSLSSSGPIILGGSLLSGATGSTSTALSSSLTSSTSSGTTNSANFMKSSSENLPPRTLARVARDVRDLVNSPPEGVRLVVDGETGMPGSLSEIVAEIEGPEQTPYHTYYFQLKLVISSDFPHAPPRGYFLTKIYHPNVDPTTGAICVNTLKADWTPTTSLSHVLKVIRCLLIVPFPESSLNDEAGKNFMDSYEEYARRAKLLAGVHGLTSWSCGVSTTSTMAGESGGGESSEVVVGGKSEGLNKEDGNTTMSENSNGHLSNNGSSAASNNGNKMVKMGSSRGNVVNKASSKSLEKKKSLRRL